MNIYSHITRVTFHSLKEVISNWMDVLVFANVIIEISSLLMPL